MNTQTVNSYITIVADKAPELDATVRERLKEGFQPFGNQYVWISPGNNVSAAKAHYVQVMVKHGSNGGSFGAAVI